MPVLHTDRITVITPTDARLLAAALECLLDLEAVMLERGYFTGPLAARSEIVRLRDELHRAA